MKLILSSLLLFFGGAATGQAWKPDGDSLLAATVELCQDPVVTHRASHDRTLRQRLSRALEKLAEQSGATPLSTLQQQLDRGRADCACPAPHPDRTDGPGVRARALPGTVTLSRRYLCGKCSNWHVSHATGFAIAAGVVVTNRHVIEKAEEGILAAVDHTERIFPVVAVLAADPVADLAILRLGGDGPFPPALPLGESALPGALVFTLSHPDGHFWFSTAGTVGRYTRERRQGAWRSVMEVTAPYAKGSSGGPVLDSRGNVVGIIAATTSVYYDEVDGRPRNLQMVLGHCVPVAALRALLQDPKPAKDPGDPGVFRVLSIPEELIAHGKRERAWSEILRVPSMFAGIYTLPKGEVDGQSPHQNDEVYYVLDGVAKMRCDGRTGPVAQGDLVFVPAGARHRFIDIEEDLELLVMFSTGKTRPAPGGTRAGGKR